MKLNFLFRRVLLLNAVLLMSTHAQSLKIDFGTSEVQPNWHSFTTNGTQPYTNAFEDNQLSEVTLSNATWKSFNPTNDVVETNLWSLLQDYAAAEPETTIHLNLKLPAGFYLLDTYHRENRVANKRDAELIYSNGSSTETHSLKSSDGLTKRIQVESDGIAPISLTYSNQFSRNLPLNGINITKIPPPPPMNPDGLWIDFGPTIQQQVGWDSFPQNGTQTYSNAFMNGSISEVTLSDAIWESFSPTNNVAETNLWNLLQDYAAIETDTSMQLTLKLPAGFYLLDTYHRHDRESNRRSADLIYSDATTEETISLSTSDGLIKQFFIESDGETPVSLTYSNNFILNLPLNGIHISQTELPLMDKGLSLDFGPATQRQPGWSYFSKNGTQSYTNAFENGAISLITLNNATWHEYNLAELNMDTDLPYLLKNYAGPEQDETMQLHLQLPAGVYTLDLYHWNKTNKKNTVLQYTDANRTKQYDLRNSTYQHYIVAHSDGTTPITLDYTNNISTEFPVNGIHITAIDPFPEIPPDNYTNSFTYNNETYTYTAKKCDLRGEEFLVKLHTNNHTFTNAITVTNLIDNTTSIEDIVSTTNIFTTYDPGPVRTYIGRVEGKPDAFIVGYLRPDYTLRGCMYWDRYSKRLEFGAENGAAPKAENLLYPQTFDLPRRQILLPNQITNGVYEFDVVVDVGSANFIEKVNSNIPDTIEAVEFSIANLASIFIRDAKLKPVLNHLVIRTNAVVDPYVPKSSNKILADEWSKPGSYLASIPQDNRIATGGSSAGLGGENSLTGINNNRFDILSRHEMGHNFNPRNDEGGYPEGATIMVRYSRMNRFSTTELYAIAEYRNKKQNSETPMFDPIGDYDVPLPPLGSYDFQQVIRDSGPITLDVLANDHDANGDPLTISRFDSTSTFGAPIQRSSEHPNQLVYTTPKYKVGLDHFFYTVTDGTFEFDGIVMINIKPKHQLIEAEDAQTTADIKTLSSGETINELNNSNTTNNQYITLLEGQQIQWKSINSAPGNYGLKTRYGISLDSSDLIIVDGVTNINDDVSITGTRPYASLDILINQTLIEEDFRIYSTGKRAEWSTLALPIVPLLSGTNTITFIRNTETGFGGSMNIDHLMVHEQADIRINFSGDLSDTNFTSTLSQGLYCHDYGAVFGERNFGNIQYGWDVPNTNVNIASINQVASVHQGTSLSMQTGGNKSWNLALDNGAYYVTIMCGDASGNSNTNALNHLIVENHAFRDENHETIFDLHSGPITITDGTLTITPASDAVDATICYLWICLQEDSADYDFDALPDRWERNHFGNLDTTPTDDPDQDKQNTLQEYIAGTDPTNAASSFRIDLNQQNIIQWPSVTDRVYQVQWTTNLLQGFTPFGQEIDYPSDTFTNVISEQKELFYKVNVRLK